MRFGSDWTHITPRTSTCLTWTRRRALRIVVLGIVGTAPLFAGAQSIPEVESRVYRLPRYQEDWSFLRDGLYGIAGNLLVPGNATEARYEGSRPIFQIDWQVDRHFSVHANYIYVFNGPFGPQAIHGTSGMSYVSPWVSYRF